MTTLNQFAVPTVDSILDFVPVFIGVLLLFWLLYKLFVTKNLSPYLGTPALVTVLMLAFLVMGGQYIDLSTWPGPIAMVMAYIVSLATKAVLWPYFLVAVIALAIRVIGIPTYKTQ